MIIFSAEHNTEKQKHRIHPDLNRQLMARITTYSETGIYRSDTFRKECNE